MGEPFTRMPRGYRGESWFKGMPAATKVVALTAIDVAVYESTQIEDSGVVLVLEPGEIITTGRQLAEEAEVSYQEFRTAERNLLDARFWTKRRSSDRQRAATIYSLLFWDRFIHPGRIAAMAGGNGRRIGPVPQWSPQSTTQSIPQSTTQSNNAIDSSQKPQNCRGLPSSGFDEQRNSPRNGQRNDSRNGQRNGQRNWEADESAASPVDIGSDGLSSRPNVQSPTEPYRAVRSIGCPGEDPYVPRARESAEPGRPDNQRSSADFFEQFKEMLAREGYYGLGPR